MDAESLKFYEGKKVKIFLKNNNLYTAKVISVSEDTIVFIDKFNARITASNDEIASINEINGGFR